MPQKFFVSDSSEEYSDELCDFFTSPEEAFRYALHECKFAKAVDKAMYKAQKTHDLELEILAQACAPKTIERPEIYSIPLGGGRMLKCDGVFFEIWGEEEIRERELMVPDLKVTSDEELKRVAEECGLTEALGGRVGGLLRLLM